MSRLSLCVLFFVFFSINIYADNAVSKNSPVGVWQTIDDNTGKPKSIVSIKKTQSGKLLGKVQKILYLDDTSDPKVTTENITCKHCSGDKKDKPIVGMTIIWGVSKDSPSDDSVTAVWDNGTILDPKTGKEYSVKLYLDEDGNKLNVRGYLGLSLLGRTQVWHRIK